MIFKNICKETCFVTSVLGVAFVVIDLCGLAEFVPNKVSRYDADNGKLLIAVPDQPRTIQPVVETFAVNLEDSFVTKELPKLHNIGIRHKVSKQEFECIAKNIFYEAGVEDHAGKIAVAQVTYNRLAKKRWGNDYCKVVYSKYQFSWTLDRKKRVETPKGPLWEKSIKAAEDFLNGTRVIGLEDVKYYHADYIDPPKWSESYTMVSKIGTHIFYKR